VLLHFWEVSSPDSVRTFLSDADLPVTIPMLGVERIHLYTAGAHRSDVETALREELIRKIKGDFPALTHVSLGYFGKPAIQIDLNPPVEETVARKIIAEIQTKLSPDLSEKSNLGYEDSKNYIPSLGMLTLTVPVGREVEYMCKIKSLQGIPFSV
jgi:hypothetical protein